MNYRADIDGLRAVAIIPVVIFHSGMSGLSGGYIGVDVFFVISGFLITGLIQSEIVDQRFSLTHFYERRVRRLAPALFVMLALCAPIGFATLNPTEVRLFGESLVSVLLFGSNIYFWQTTGYFGSTSELTPMLHTWTLAVEEQFYIVLPLVLLAVGRWRLRWLLALFIAGTLGSLLVAEWGWRNSPVANFYLLPARAWEFLLGAIAALVSPYATRLLSDRRFWRSCISTLAILVLAGSFVWFDEHTPHPGLPTMLPVVATTLLVVTPYTGTWVNRFLSSRPIVLIGLMSYSLYLWHQPIFAFAKRALGPDYDTAAAAGMITATAAAAYLSWRFVERPFRQRQRFGRRAIFRSAALASSLAMAVSGVMIVKPEAFLQLAAPSQIAQFRMLDEIRLNQGAINRECRLWTPVVDDAFRAAFDECASLYGEAVVITGGSHGIDLYNAIAANSEGSFVVGVSRGGCRAHHYIGLSRQPLCHYADLRDFLVERRNRVSLLIYTQVPDRLFARDMHGASVKDLYLPAVHQVLAYLASVRAEAGVEVVMIGMLPPLLESLAPMQSYHRVADQLGRAFSRDLVDLTGEIDAFFAGLAAAEGIGYLPKTELMSLDLPRDLLIGGRLTYSGSRHLSHFGKCIFGRRLITAMAARGYTQFERKSSSDMSGNDVAGNDVAGNDVAGNDLAGNDLAGNDGAYEHADHPGASDADAACIAQFRGIRPAI